MCCIPRTRPAPMLSLLLAFPSRASRQSLRIGTLSPSAFPRCILSSRTPTERGARKVQTGIGLREERAADPSPRRCRTTTDNERNMKVNRARTSQRLEETRSGRRTSSWGERGRRADGAAGHETEFELRTLERRKTRLQCTGHTFHSSSPLLLCPLPDPLAGDSLLHSGAPTPEAVVDALDPLRLKQEAQRRKEGSKKETGGRRMEEEERLENLISTATLQRPGGSAARTDTHARNAKKIASGKSQCKRTASRPPTPKKKERIRQITHRNANSQPSIRTRDTTLGCPPRLYCIEDSDGSPAERIEAEVNVIRPGGEVEVVVGWM
ncbi:hypothetical protein C8R45DRAFT_940619 [Mycena sanguinolenta]|nr:hypothetical protein C8R45DRAFT_940619 [Mycena sanguinolenta]